MMATEPSDFDRHGNKGLFGWRAKRNPISVLPAKSYSSGMSTKSIFPNSSCHAAVQPSIGGDKALGTRVELTHRLSHLVPNEHWRHKLAFGETIRVNLENPVFSIWVFSMWPIFCPAIALIPLRCLKKDLIFVAHPVAERVSLQAPQLGKLLHSQG